MATNMNELQNQQDNHDKIQAEISKLLAETAKINAESKWYPFVVATGLILACLGVIKLLG